MEEKYTTCRVEHRDYVPYGYIAVEFCHVEFTGKDWKKYEKEWNNIKFKKLHETEKEIKYIDEELETITKEIEILSNAETAFKKEIRGIRKKLPILTRIFKGNTEEIKYKKKVLETLQNTMNCKIIKYNELVDYKNILNKDKFYEQDEIMYKIKKYLKNNGFRIINSSQSGGECVTKTDIWQKEY